MILTMEHVEQLLIPTKLFTMALGVDIVNYPELNEALIKLDDAFYSLRTNNKVEIKFKYACLKLYSDIESRILIKSIYEEEDKFTKFKLIESFIKMPITHEIGLEVLDVLKFKAVTLAKILKEFSNIKEFIQDNTFTIAYQIADIVDVTPNEQTVALLSELQTKLKNTML